MTITKSNFPIGSCGEQTELLKLIEDLKILITGITVVIYYALIDLNLVLTSPNLFTIKQKISGKVVCISQLSPH